MPAYTVEFTTPEGPRRSPFTLDPERALGPQVRQVLEELRQRGSVIAGGPGDEMTVAWNGRELDLRRTPAELEITPARDLVIRMRPAARAAPRPEPAALRRRPRTFTRGAFAAPMTGAAGAIVAWAASSALRDLGPVVPTYARLDLAAAVLLGGVAGAFVVGGAALRTQAPAIRAALAGVALGAAGGALGAVLGGAAGAAVGEGFAARRVVAWLVLGACVAAMVALRWALRDPRRVAEGMLCGALGGAAAGAVFTLGGPGDFWQALAFALVGASAGFGACSLAVRRAAGVVELEEVAGRVPGLLRHREWELGDGARVRIRAGRRSGGGEAVLAHAEGRAWAGPAAEGETVRVASRRVAAPVELADGDALDLGGARYRYRRFASAA